MNTLRTQFEITSVLQVTLDQNLIELYLNIENDTRQLCLVVYINHDGETLILEKRNTFIRPEDVSYEIFTTRLVEAFHEAYPVSKILRKPIMAIKLGINDFDSTRLYYFVIEFEESTFLYFNNGDDGQIHFENIDAITSADPFCFSWLSCSVLETIDKIENKTL